MFDGLGYTLMPSCRVGIAERLVDMGEASVGTGPLVTVVYLDSEGQCGGVFLLGSSRVPGGE